MKPNLSIFERIAAVTSLAAFAVGSSGCFVVVSGTVRNSTTINMHLEGTIIGPSGPWSGSGQTCFKIRTLASFDDQVGCEIFTTDRPGHFKIDKDITSQVHEMSSMFSAGDASTYIEIPNRFNGEVLSSSVESRSQTLNGSGVTLTDINLQATYKVNVPNAASVPPMPTLSLAPASNNGASFDRNLYRGLSATGQAETNSAFSFGAR